MTQMPPRALVVLRVPRGSDAPDGARIRAAIAADRARLSLPSAPLVEYRLAGPYAIQIGADSLDEYVAWEI